MDYGEETHHYRLGGELYSYELPNPVGEGSNDERYMDIDDNLDSESAMDRLNKLLNS